MTAFFALLLGLVQGVTEFLPVSSSAHLEILKKIFNLNGASDLVLLDLTCHLGTLLALFFFLRKEIYDLFNKERKELIHFFIALLPLVPFYFLLKPLRLWCSQGDFLGICLMLTSLILFAGGWLSKKVTTRSSKNKTDAIWIGTMQALALIPGISRSASTISMARFLGWDPKEAVRFSFLLAIPTVIGGSVLEVGKELLSPSPLFIFPLSIYLIAFFSSFLAGFTLCHFAISFLQKGNLKPFGWYCLTLGLVVSIYW